MHKYAAARSAAIELYKEGEIKEPADIAAALGQSVLNITRWLRKWRQTGTASHAHTSGRPSKMEALARSEMMKLLKQQPEM